MNDDIEKTPEKIYEEILISGDMHAAIIFLRNEINIINDVYHLIKLCQSDEEFETKILILLSKIKTIRIKKLDVIKNNIKFYQLKQKRYYKKLFDLLQE